MLVVAGSGALGVLAVGLADDILKLRAGREAGADRGDRARHGGAGTARRCAGLLAGRDVVELPWLIAIAGSAFWLIVVINAVNFMDGANGLAMGMACVAALGWRRVAL